MWKLLAPTMLALILALPARGDAPKVLKIPLTTTAPTIDGKLDDPCWKTGARGDGFVLRRVGGAALEPTEFFVCHDETSLYFGFYCHDSQPEGICAMQKQRDGDLWNDDYVEIFLDAYHDHRSAEEFFVNAIGTQRDERKRGTAQNITWKGDWHAAAVRVSDGWTAEMQIPFSILSYKAGTSSMGLNIRRGQRRLGEVSVWNYVNFDEQFSLYGDLEGLKLPPPPRPKPQFMPYLLRSLLVGGHNTGRVGLDMKQRFGADSTVLLTAFPEFGTIERAINSIDFTYTTPRYPDNRPFFQEASSTFGSSYLYTNLIPDFDYGAKLFGKEGNLTYGLMGCAGPDRRTDSVASIACDLPAFTSAKLMMIGRNDDVVDNRVLALNLSGQPIPSTRWSLWGARSATGGAARNGEDAGGSVEISLPRWRFSASMGRVSEFFSPASGIVDYPGARSWHVNTLLRTERPRSDLRRWDLVLDAGGIRDDAHGLIDRSRGIELRANLANHTSWNLSRYWGPHIGNYDESDPDGTPYFWNQDARNTATYGFNTNDMYRVGQLQYQWGSAGGGPSQSAKLRLGFLPRERFSTTLSLQRIHRENPEEGKVTLWLGVLGGRYELTNEKSLGMRLLTRKEGTNLTFSYRQRVRRGLDIFVLLGDYNADQTRNDVSVKLIASK